MRSKSPTNHTGGTDFKKLYSSHVQENKFLQKQKSSIDEEKVRAYKNLTHEESAFLRKYEKYTRSYSGKRRQSIDANILRIADTNTHRDFNAVCKSLGRDAINNDFPYSFSSWNRMVNADCNVLEHNKSEILSGPDFDTDLKNFENSDKSENGVLTTSHQDLKYAPTEAVNVEIDSEYSSLYAKDDMDGQGMNRRRTSLKPIDKSLLSNNSVNVLENKEKLDLEELSPRSVVKSAYRRHSVTPILPVYKRTERRRSEGVESTKLPSITETLKHDNSPKKILRRKSKSDNDLIVQVESGVTINTQKPVSVPRLKLNDTDTDMEKLMKHGLKADSPRPVPNAAVFVRGDTGVSERKDMNKQVTEDTNKHVKNHDNIMENVEIQEPDEGDHEGFLPDITQTQTLVQSPRQDYLKMPVRDRSVSFCGVSQEASATFSSQRIGAARRASMGTTTLNLLVENTKGAARLRYIAMLATEMEREEKQKLNIIRPTPGQEPSPNDMMRAVQGCRYLRVSEPDSFENIENLF